MLRLSTTTFIRRDGMGNRTRVRLLVATSGLVLLGLVAVMAVLLVHGANGMIASSADARARHGADLLVNVGPRLPRLTAAGLVSLSRTDAVDLDRAVAKGQQEGVLAAVSVFDVEGRRVYPRVAPAGPLALIEPEVLNALGGQDVVRRHPAEIDPTTGKKTGVLDAFEPLRNPDGTIFGVVETSLRLEPIVADSARIQTRIVLFLLLGAALVWLVLMPVIVRAARATAVAWTPGRRRMLQAFERALDNHEIELVYQPQVASDGTPVAVEALVRWRRDGVLLPPSAFLPMVESSHLVDALTDRVLDIAIAQAAAWHADGHHLTVSVNLSARNLADPILPDRIGTILARHRVPATYLTIEITETGLIEYPASALAIVDALSDAGISIAVDDFGVGHASIARLHDLHVHELKIDKSFIIPTEERTRSYAAAMIQFGRTLGLRVVAEGIEDEAALSFVRGAGADLAQGYYLSRPLAAGDVTPWLVAARRTNGLDIRPAPIASNGVIARAAMSGRIRLAPDPGLG